MLLRPAALGLAALPLLVFAACSDDETPASAPTGDAGPDAAEAAPVVPNANQTKQVGKIIRAQSENEGVPNAVVTVAGNTVTANATGDYEILVPRGTPYQMTAAAEGYYKLIEQEWIVDRDVHTRGNSNLLPVNLAQIVAGVLPGRKPEKGLVIVKVNVKPPCTSEEGSTLAIDPPGEAKVAYFSGPLPDHQQASMIAGTTFSAVIYNVEVGVPLEVTVTSPACVQMPFPVQDGEVTYTGVQRTEPGESLSYLRLFLKDTIAKDAGADG